MSTTKAALKAAKSALDGQNYDEAITQAKKVIENDDKNYFGHLFLGRALEKRSNFDEAVDAYKKATKIKPEDELAWKGLCGSLEALGSHRIEDYIGAAIELAQVYQQADDQHQCQTVVDKMVSFVKEHGSREDYRKALTVLLPTSPVFSFLEGRIPTPSFTYHRLAEMTEDEEKETINKLIGDRRTRLGAKINQVTLDVKREVFAKSQLDELYQQIINWTNDDDERRLYEEKLLQRAYDQLTVLPPEDKTAKRDQVIKLAHDTVIIKNPLRLAWQLELDWKDFEDVSDLDKNVLLEFVEFFPESGLAKIITGFLGYEIKKSNSNDGADANADETNGGEKTNQISAEERLLLVEEGLNDSKDSPFAYRLVAVFYLQLGEYESCISLGRQAQILIEVESKKCGLRFESNLDAVNSILATSLVYYQSPKNHPEAKTLFDEILKRKPNSTPALLGVGLIYEEQERYEEAARFLEKALIRDPDNIRIGAEAAWCKAQSGDLEQGLEQLKSYLAPMNVRNFKEQDLKARTEFRVGKCLWNMNSDKAARKSRKGAYAHFLAAIKADHDFAPAYTSLGVYYADYAKDKNRARQCFQKAFELSPNEILAAERLARAFADDGEWDIVEIVSQRVIDSGVAKPAPGSKRRGVSWPFAAMAVVQMNRQEYPKSVVSFQAAIRISPLNYHAWVGLGESYHSSGRYNAAQRTLEHALELASDSGGENGDVWFAEYMLANVHRELGDFEAAVDGYSKVLQRRPSEFGVSIALLQTLVEQSWSRLQTGYFGLSARSAQEAIRKAQKMDESYRSAFNFWKAVGDACSIFSQIPRYFVDVPSEILIELLDASEENPELHSVEKSDGVTMELLQSVIETSADQTEHRLQAILFSALLAYKKMLQTCSHEPHAQAVGWFNLGWAEYRAFTCLSRDDEAQSSLDASRFGKAAVRCFKKSIELEAGNAEFWNALGVATTKLNPAVAQHSFVRSLNLNERNARTWTNLGVLYMTQNDHELAHDAFARSQSTDPDYANAWLGEGLIALLVGDLHEALSHFTHAVEIGEASSFTIQSQYAISVFDGLLSIPSKNSGDTADLIQPVFALQQLQSQIYDATAYRHLIALLQERISDCTTAVSNLETVCSHMEAKYEENESAVFLGQFAQAKSDLARNLLGISEYKEASENAETALDLLEEPDSSLTEPQRQKARLSCQLTAGLSNYYLGTMDKSIEMFRAALEESDGAADVVCLLSQILWAKGGEEEKTAAKDQLFDCVEKSSGHINATMLVGAMSTIDGDEETAEAVADDLRQLTVNGDFDATTRQRIMDLLSSLAAFLRADTSDTKADEVNEAATSIYMSPWLPQGWSNLSKIDDGHPYPADMALKTAEKAAPPFGTLATEQLSKILTGTNRISNDQRAVVLSPWLPGNWECLASSID